MKSPLDAAILAAHPFDMAAWKKIDEVPFDFERRRVSVLVEHAAERRLIVKGAPEDLLRLSGHFEDADGNEQPLDAATRQAFEATLEGLGAQGFRALGVASRVVDASHATAAFADEMRPRVLRLRRFPRSAEGQRRRDDPGDGGGGCRGQGADRRQRAGDPPCVRSDRRAGHGRSHRRRTDAHLGRGAARQVAHGPICFAGSIHSRNIGSCWR